MKRKYTITTFLIITIVMVVGFFLNYTYKNFKVHEKFISIPLSFDPASSTSKYNWKGTFVEIRGGFVKGKIIDDNKNENLILRSLSPTPTITVQGTSKEDKTYYIRLENVNPVNIIIKNIDTNKQKIIDSHTILVEMALKQNETKTIEVVPKDNDNYSEFVILGDNRNGYQTFSQIIQQINSIKPLFVIDNGDLVFGGETNKYRLFYETVSKLQVPLYTTLGNHDIREGGRPIYTKL